MLTIEILRWLHVIGATVLIGTGAGIAFFMVMAHRTGAPALIAHTASIVVVADVVFTMTAAIAQPITGALLIETIGWSWREGWVVASLALYVFIGVFWIPVIVIQQRLRDLAREAAANGAPLPARYRRLYRIWFACGIPAFTAILALLWLMVTKPALG